jgi:hypothetical protein
MQTNFMHCTIFREIQRSSHKTAQTLPQCSIPALYVSRFTCFLPNWILLIFRYAIFVDTIEVCETFFTAICQWNCIPQFFTCFLRPITDRIGNHLSCFSTQSNPNPGFVHLFLRALDHNSSHSTIVAFASFGSGSINVSLNSGRCSAFFFSHLITVERETPNTLPCPRKLLRSS